ncbi:hypothetical protein OEZ85_003033 [Tetradesmus obliquus]|uniref:Anaphase-promoting complex subunit 4 WD40 domain-containing protein n=1 Tax=Tetradesmus obliquus TaxID=3088 RepID=A0ABY8TZD4_TETOB|nr:hypothetical protein OEZ85_003033 [Tetradesmus obliquus]
MVTSVFAAPAETCFGHTGRVFGLAYHPSSHQVLASASEDESVRLWSRSTPSGSWQQASCCRGHSAEVLRVAWSPDGEILASGSADHTVRLWQVGTEGSHSYSGVELAVLSGHPEEVYGLKFIGISTAGSTTAAAAAAQQQHAGQPSAQQFSSSSSDGGVSDTLVTASGESLFLWDLATGRMLQECAPVPLTGLAGLNVNGDSRSSQRRKDANGSSRQQQAVAAAGGSRPPAGQRAAAVQQQQQRTEQHESANALQGTEQQQQQQQQPDAFLGPDETEDDNNEDEEEEESDEEPSGPPMLSYIFSLAAAEGTAWLAGSCADGMLRLWDAGQGALQEVAAVQARYAAVRLWDAGQDVLQEVAAVQMGMWLLLGQQICTVHVGNMGSVCSFVPQQPWLVLTISKSRKYKSEHCKTP